MITVNFSSATDTYFCRNATADFLPPNQMDYVWEPMNITKSFPFNETKGDWFAFKGQTNTPEGYDPNRHRIILNFQIKAVYNVRRWDDEFPAGPEGRMWLNGSLIGAIDEFHNYHVVDGPGFVDVRIFTARCSSNHKLEKFGLSIVDKPTEKLYHYLKVIEKTLKEVTEPIPQKDQLIEIVNQVLPLIDIRDLTFPIKLPEIRYRDINHQKFYESVPIALAKLLELLESMPKHTENDPFINVIGYSHLDSTWEWTYNTSHYKFANTVASMLHLIENPPSEETPKWRFLATSALHYKWLQKDDPELYERVIKAAKDGRFEVDGVTFLEPDTNLPSGESFVRQILYGVKYFESLGFKQSTLFLPDCFGFSPAIPQLLRNAGIENFVTSKISWNEYNSFPHHTFIWRGIDGSEVLSHFITTPSSWSYQTFTYTGLANMPELIGTYKCYNHKTIPGVALHTAGNGDGGGGLTEEMLWNMEVVNKLPKIDGVPHLKFQKVSEIFETIKDHKQELPTWDGELYLEYHRGTATTQEEVKRQNKLLEAHLHNCEWLMTMYKSLYWNTDFSLQRKLLDESWETALMLQFHDALPGTSVNEANNDILQRGSVVIKNLKDLENKLAKMLSDKMRVATEDNTKILFNTHAFKRNIQGINVPSGGWTQTTKEIEKKEFTNSMYEILKQGGYKENLINISEYKVTKHSNVSFDEKTFSVITDNLNVTFSPINGSIIQIRDVKSGRPFLRSLSNVFEFYEDRSIHWPAWDIQLYHKEMQLKGPSLIDIKFKDNAIYTRYKFDDCENSTYINQTITFGEEGIIDFDTNVDWQEHDKLLKIMYDTNIRNKEASYGTQFGHHLRPTHENLPQDMAQFEVSARWTDLSDSTGGISLTADAKYGYDIHDGKIRLSLLKSPLQTDMWADYGRRHFTYRMQFHSSRFDSTKITKYHYDLITPPVVADYEQPTTPISSENIPMESSFVSSSSDNIIVDTLKLSEDNSGIVFRVFEASGGWSHAEISFPLLDKKLWKVVPVNILEKPVDFEFKVLDKPSLAISIDLDAFKIATFKLERLEVDDTTIIGTVDGGIHPEPSEIAKINSEQI